ncbi:DUF4429 domain-containing protein [Allosalinactinospora lopnorensis]|uniref:DUF4429 domain-containing protein n=1 Tax=Allosalinactinospora lopnorensis TaxID=1352348 RepID=UPI000697143E|nr:DUF4429 domain-containing protein [Allosalinactinospora lopnorensis]
MDQLKGDRATWRFDGETVLIRYHTGRRIDPVLDALGQCAVPVAAIDSVEFRTGRRTRRWGRTKNHWRLRTRLDQRADPFAAVGAMLREASDPLLLTGSDETELVAEYHAEQLEVAATTARETGSVAPPGLATRLVPSLPLHIQTVEGTAGFDGTGVRLTWSGPETSSRKRKRQRREIPLAQIAGAEWVPGRHGDYGYLRVVERPPDSTLRTVGHSFGITKPAATDNEATAPDKDFNCLRCRGSAENARILLMAAAITAHVWALDAKGQAEPAPGD